MLIPAPSWLPVALFMIGTPLLLSAFSFGIMVRDFLWPVGLPSN
jgi:hypothetical protein